MFILNPLVYFRYPKAVKYLMFSLPTVIDMPVIVRAMKKYGQLDKAAFRQALGWGSWPLIKVLPIADACGQFYPRPKNNEIEIDEQVFIDFEAGRGLLNARAGKVPALGLNVLHEMCHWGDNADGVHRKADAGDLFELAVYGRDLSC